MRARTLVAAIVATAFAGGGMLYAQPGATPTPDPGKAAPGAGSGTAAPTPAPDLPDVSLPTEKDVKLSTQEMDENAAKLITEMEGIHRHTLELKASAQQAKDVIKLNCVNENLLAVKQLLNIADAAQNELDEAIARGERSEQVHQFGQITIAS